MAIIVVNPNVLTFENMQDLLSVTTRVDNLLVEGYDWVTDSLWLWDNEDDIEHVIYEASTNVEASRVTEIRVNITPAMVSTEG